MTLAQLLQPGGTVLLHAHTKGAQFGAAGALLLALPALSLAPATLNASHAPPLVALARLCGGGAAVGSAAAGALCVSRLSRLSLQQIDTRAVKIRHSRVNRGELVASSIGASLALALLGVRINGLMRIEGARVRDVLDARMGWDAYCFAMMGSGVAFAALRAFKFVRCKMAAASGGANDEAEQQQQQQEEEGGDGERDALLNAREVADDAAQRGGASEMKQVREHVQQAVSDMNAELAANDNGAQ